MQQRLGIAHALLGNPKVLILDEPANGLDPAGIRWMRSLLKHFAENGGTVLLSSHLLHEVEQIADEMILIGRGKIVAQGNRAALLSSAGATMTVVRSLDNALLETRLKERGFAVAPDTDGLRVTADPIEVGKIAAEEQLVLTHLSESGEGLEDLFLQLTAETQREGDVA
jgi:ABC-2 type transport system ATP-binding protein